MFKKIAAASIAVIAVLGFAPKAYAFNDPSCGSGYIQRYSYTMQAPNAGPIVDYYQLFFNPTTRTACAYTVKGAGAPLTASLTKAGVRPTGMTGWGTGWDTGYYLYYAGPVYAHINPGVCIDMFQYAVANNGTVYSHTANSVVCP